MYRDLESAKFHCFSCGKWVLVRDAEVNNHNELQHIHSKCQSDQGGTPLTFIFPRLNRLSKPAGIVQFFEADESVYRVVDMDLMQPSTGFNTADAIIRGRIEFGDYMGTDHLEILITDSTIMQSMLGADDTTDTFSASAEVDG